MNREEVFQFIRTNPVFYLATCENGQAHVRAMTLFAADEHGIVFNTCQNKWVYRQLLDNPRVEMCFYNPVQGVQIRIRGKAEPVEDRNFKQEIAEKYPVLRSLLLREEGQSLGMFCLTEARAWIWEIERDFDPTRMTNDEMASVWLALYSGPRLRNKTDVNRPIEAVH